jgi:hypothetical protein
LHWEGGRCVTVMFGRDNDWHNLEQMGMGMVIRVGSISLTQEVPVRCKERLCFSFVVTSTKTTLITMQQYCKLFYATLYTCECGGR